MLSDNTLNSRLRQNAAFLASMGIQNSLLEAEMIFSAVLKVPRLELALQPHRELSDEECEGIAAMVKRRAMHEPLQYIFGEAGFRKLLLSVGPGVLIPRPETELLVDYVISRVSSGVSVLDLCTGPGTIAVALATECPEMKVTATDICSNALRYAAINRDKYGLSNLRLLQGDLFEAVPGERFDVITANPPYVATAEYLSLDKEVRDFEPEKALLGGEDGLVLIRRLTAEAPGHLNPGGFIILELGIEQAASVSELLLSAGFERVMTIQDYNSRDRFVAATFP